MTVTFQINYRTEYGQTLCVVETGESISGWTEQHPLQLQCQGTDFWTATVQVSDFLTELEYKYAIRVDGGYIYEAGDARRITLRHEEKNLTVLQGDIMAVDLPKITEPLSRPFAVVANIPYYITTPLITRLLTSGLDISRLALMVQKEVADKILSSPGDEGWGPLAIRCRYMCEPYRAMEVPAACFTPPPKVDSTFIVMPVREKPAVEVKDEEMFFRVAAAAFALRRKTMVNNLCATFRAERAQAVRWMADAGLDEKVRGERLSLEDLARLADVMAEGKESI